MQELREAVRRVEIYTGMTEDSAILVQAQKDTMQVGSGVTRNGAVVSPVSCSFLQGETLLVKIPISYVSKALEVVRCEKVRILHTPNSTSRHVVLSACQDQVRYMIMPTW